MLNSPKSSDCTMAQPRLSRLQRVVQKIGLGEVIPNLNHASDAELQAPFAKFLHFSECHRDLDIPAKNFNPTILPEIAVTEVRNAVEDRLLGDRRSPLMMPYFSTMSMAEIRSVMSQHPSESVAHMEPPLDSDDFLGCRMFFRVVAEAVEQGFRIVILNDEEHTLALIVHIKALRLLKANAGAVQRESKETVLLQVEYNCMGNEDAHREKAEKILSDLIEQHPTGKTRIVLGTKHQIHFAFQVLQAHERLLSKTVISEHDKQWKPRQKFIRPSFIVPLRPITECNATQEILQEIQATVSPASGHTLVESHACEVCGKADVKLKVCSGCKSVNYCGHECQVADWQSHKPTCRAMRSDPK